MEYLVLVGAIPVFVVVGTLTISGLYWIELRRLTGVINSSDDSIATLDHVDYNSAPSEVALDDVAVESDRTAVRGSGLRHLLLNRCRHAERLS